MHPRQAARTHAGQLGKAVRTDAVDDLLHVTDRDAFLPVRTSTALLWAIRQECPDFEWRTHAYEFVDSIPAIDLLFGSERPRLAMDSGADWNDLSRLLETPHDCARQIQAVRLPDYGSAT
jgi:uncharacterized protein YbbC (DUF1343 family)